MVTQQVADNIMRRIIQTIGSISKITGSLAGWIIPFMMVLVLYEVFMRYVIGQPAMIADEFSGYLLVVMTFIGAAVTWKEGGHVRITALVSRLPGKAANRMRLVGLLVALFFAFVLCQGGYRFVSFSFKYGLSSATHLHTPLQIFHLSILIGFVLLTLQIIADILEIHLKQYHEKSNENKRGDNE
jgi:TRAP-type C4-dicarboxylate transport system permease small subunit